MAGLAAQFSEGSIRKCEDKVESSSILLQSVVDKLVGNYAGPLDEFMRGIRPVLENTREPITDQELEAAILKLSSLMYFLGDAMENIGIRADIAKAIRDDVYNNAHSKAEGTVSDKQTKAMLASQEETLVQSAYERAYKRVKGKLDLGSDVLGALKRVMNKRSLELERLGYKNGE